MKGGVATPRKRIKENLISETKQITNGSGIIITRELVIKSLKLCEYANLNKSIHFLSTTSRTAYHIILRFLPHANIYTKVYNIAHIAISIMEKTKDA